MTQEYTFNFDVKTEPYRQNFPPNNITGIFKTIFNKNAINNDFFTFVKNKASCCQASYAYCLAKNLSDEGYKIELVTYTMPLQEYFTPIKNVKWTQYYNPRDKLDSLLGLIEEHPSYSLNIQVLAALYLTLFITSIFIHFQISYSIATLVGIFFTSTLFFRLCQYLTLTKYSRAKLVSLSGLNSPYLHPLVFHTAILNHYIKKATRVFRKNSY